MLGCRLGDGSECRTNSKQTQDKRLPHSDALSRATAMPTCGNVMVNRGIPGARCNAVLLSTCAGAVHNDFIYS